MCAPNAVTTWNNSIFTSKLQLFKIPKCHFSCNLQYLQNFCFSSNFRNQLIRKQNELVQFLNFTTSCEELNNEEDIDNPVTEETLEVEELFENVDYVEVDEEIFDIDLETESDGERCEGFQLFGLLEEEETTQDEPVFEPFYEQDAIESDTDLDTTILSAEEVATTPRFEEIKYEKKTPTLILTANYLKVREALKRLPAQQARKDSDITDYTTVTLIEDSVEKNVYVCNNPDCKVEFESEEEMKCHVLDHYSDGSLQKCEWCPKVFKSRHFYEKHVDEVHNGSQLVCQVCGKILDTKIKLRSHIRNHDQTLKFKCTFKDCTKAFRVKHHLNNHSRVHSKVSPFCCTFEGCSARFRQKHALTIHLRKHNKDFKVCAGCKSPFITQFRLNKHLEKCDGTFKPIVTRGSLYNRKDSVESDEYKCSVAGCESSFKTKKTLEKHLTKIHQIAVTETVCVVCCHDFGSQQELKSHLREHLPYICTVCSACFRSGKNLKNHMTKSHEKDEVRLHRCLECSVSFKRAEHLRSHITYKHNKARPYSCDSCSYTSPTRHDLNAHMKRHIKIKDFSCRLCNFEAKKLSAIKVHMKSVHETEEYYLCYNCNRGFKYQNDFYQHQKECYV